MEKKIKPKLKPRGKPFPKGNTKGKQVIEQTEFFSNVEISPILEPLPSPLKEIIKTAPIVASYPKETQKDAVIEENAKEPWEIIEEIPFKNGENNLTIRFIKRSNRTYRVKIFLNNEIEIRPATYTGAATAEPFWNLLKRSLKNE